MISRRLVGAAGRQRSLRVVAGVQAAMVRSTAVQGILAALAAVETVPTSAGPPAAAASVPQCTLADATWSYMAPADFEGVAANNEVGCL